MIVVLKRIADDNPFDYVTSESPRYTEKWEIWKTPHGSAELRFPLGKEFGEESPLRDLQEGASAGWGDPIVLEVGIQKRDFAHFGGSVRRRIKAIRYTDLEDLGKPLLENQVSWQTLLGPITPYEAWLACLKSKMELQGIMARGYNGNTLRVCRTRSSEKGMFFVVVDRGGLPIDGDLEIDPSCPPTPPEFWVSNLESEIFPLQDFNFLAAVEENYGEPSEGKGWEVSGVWRQSPQIMEQQAALFDMTVNQLLRRLDRRERAAQRKR